MDRPAHPKEIETLFFSGHKAKDTNPILDQKHEAKSPSLRTVFWWIHEMKWSNSDLRDSVGSGRLKCQTNSENIELVAKLVKENPKFFLRIIGEVVNVSKDSVREALNKHLDMIEMSARWVHKELTAC